MLYSSDCILQMNISIHSIWQSNNKVKLSINLYQIEVITECVMCTSRSYKIENTFFLVFSKTKEDKVHHIIGLST